MEKNGNYNIVLEQGKARKSFFEMTDEEQLEAAKRIFEKVKRLAAEVGELPVVGKYSKSTSQKPNS